MVSSLTSIRMDQEPDWHVFRSQYSSDFLTWELGCSPMWGVDVFCRFSNMRAFKQKQSRLNHFEDQSSNNLWTSRHIHKFLLSIFVGRGVSFSILSKWWVFSFRSDFLQLKQPLNTTTVCIVPQACNGVCCDLSVIHWRQKLRTVRTVSSLLSCFITVLLGLTGYSCNLIRLILLGQMWPWHDVTLWREPCKNGYNFGTGVHIFF